MENLIRIWDINTKQIISQLDFETNYAKKIMISKTGKFLVLGISDNSTQYFSINKIEKDLSRNFNFKLLNA